MSETVNILIVDDLPEKLLVCQSILEELQQNLVLARSGREALQKLLEDDFAVILLDVNMPDMDGFETAKLIRQYRRTKQTPIVFITAYMDDIQSMRGYALGAVDYISTPVVPDVLRSKVKVFVDLYRMQVQLRRQAEEREALARAEAARDAAEVAMRRADLLADASHILTRSLDIDSIINGLLTFSISHFAAISVVLLFSETGKMTRASLLYYEHNYRRVDIELLPAPVNAAIERISLKDDLLDIADAGELSVLRDGASALTLVLGVAKLLPLFARGTLIGAILLAQGPDILNDRDDDNLLKEIAGRAAIAIENSLLYSAIREGDRHKNEFLAMLSHELRNPLAPIRNAVHILQAQPSINAQAQWATEAIARQVDHMAHLLNDLLDVSRIERGAVTIKQSKIFLSEIIERALETSQPLLDASQHRLEVQLPPYDVELHGDIVRLAQVFSNLLNNAIKYSPEGSDIWISAIHRDNDVTVSVRDNGHGIDAEFMPRIFDLFSQGDKSIDRTQSGLGVGLSLAKHLIALHNGTIEAKSAGLDKGSEFVVTLPGKRVEQNTRYQTNNANALAGADVAITTSAENNHEDGVDYSGRVLVVDDLETSAQSMKILLELKGYQVEAVHDGPAALKLATQFKPDVVLLDIGLPGMDGYEVSRQLHLRLPTATPFIIGLTGYGQESDRAKSTEAGFDAHVVKPANIDELLVLIAKYCDAHAQQPKHMRLA